MAQKKGYSTKLSSTNDAAIIAGGWKAVEVNDAVAGHNLIHPETVDNEASSSSCDLSRVKGRLWKSRLPTPRPKKNFKIVLLESLKV